MSNMLSVIMAHAATTSVNCTVNGMPADPAQCQQALAALVPLFAVTAVFGIIFSAFWIWMLVHAIINPIPNKVLWIVLLFLFSFPAALFYFFIVMRPFKATGKPSITVTYNSGAKR